MKATRTKIKTKTIVAAIAVLTIGTMAAMAVVVKRGSAPEAKPVQKEVSTGSSKNTNLSGTANNATGVNATNSAPSGGGDCGALFERQQNFFDICKKNNFESACFDKNTGQFQGCVKKEKNDCTDKNVNAPKNILCPVS